MKPAPDGIAVDRGTMTDIEDVAPLFDAYRVFYEQVSDPRAARAFVAERIQNDQSVIFLAHCEDKPAGFTQLYPTFSSVSLKPLWILNDLYVEKVWRQRGVAKALVEYAKRFAIHEGAKGLILETAITNTEAQKLYEATGWTRDTEFYRYFLNV